ncbi:succinylglutamate desuccinylase/aspartoacylase family protein [Candidatus Sumerlaeota bacterium]|nr:succinylglutamate desuccinylase/aspartoacylase family protein [Candidatus Sumerlaeota bacterium]
MKKKTNQNLNYSFLKIMTGSDLSQRRLAMMKAKSPKPGPVVWLTGCSHGDEVGGVVVIQEIFKRLRKYPLIQGELNAFPLMNPMGFEVISRQISIGNEDLNRSFPGNKNGSLAHRIAHTIFAEITKTRPAVVLDLHNDWRSSIPYTVIDPFPGEHHREIYSLIQNFARKTGLLMIQEQGRDTEENEFQKTLSGSLMIHQIPALTLELGEAYVVNEQNVQYGVRSVWNILTHLGMTQDSAAPFAYPLLPEFQGKILRYSHKPLSASSGIIRFLANPGDPVRHRQPVARVYNAFGKLLETVTAQENGIVLGHSDSSVAYPGLPVLAFGLL